MISSSPFYLSWLSYVINFLKSPQATRGKEDIVKSTTAQTGSRTKAAHNKQILRSQGAMSGPKLQNENAVEIRESSGKGRGVFARLELPKGHAVIVEKALFSCTYWRQKGLRTHVQDWTSSKSRTRLELKDYFPTKLANIPDEKLADRDRKRLKRFIKEYAFWDTRLDRAHIYKLASHINHACASCANASHFTECSSPNLITIRLLAPIKAGDELFICYNKSNLPYRCAVCRATKKPRL